MSQDTFTGLEIAIIGMAGKFPEANNLEEFWDNLTEGKNCISFFDEQDMDKTFLQKNFNTDNYICARGILKDPECFDAAFFGYSPHEALMMDPQTRVLHEMVWHALEDAGYDPFRYDGDIGLYAAASSNFLHESFSIFNNISDTFRNIMLADKDYSCSRVAYKLNLKGPVFNVQTACSSSLVAVDVACKSLLNGQCSIALAGGISILLPENKGYFYEEGMVFSKDGLCRPFDDEASGTVFSNGGGMVVLKRLDDALTDMDHIYGVIRGSAVNNDGNEKGGYSTPSVNGQAAVITAALDMAEVSAESVSYIECHGTATKIGDPVEIEGLCTAFSSKRKAYCAIGSVKGNIGHLDVAAGIAGLIKTTLSIYHKKLLPSINFKSPNSHINFNETPFYVNTSLKPWKSDFPRRAGVSSFGIGGTNAHVLLEEFNGKAPVTTITPKENILLFSALTQEALDMSIQKMKTWLEENETVDMAILSNTLAQGRKRQHYSALLVCKDRLDAIDALKNRPEKLIQFESGYDIIPEIVFMFPGEGTSYHHMAVTFYKQEPYFMRTMDHCFALIQSLTGDNYKQQWLYPDGMSMDDFSPITPTDRVPLMIFIVEYSLAQFMIHLGIVPDAMIGHSLGEYVAACVAGVMCLEDAIQLVYHRGRLMRKAPVGRMMSIAASVELVKRLLIPALEVAVINNENACVVSGPEKDCIAFCAILEEQEVSYRILNIPYASHCYMMEPILEEYKKIVDSVNLYDPQIPIVSCVTGDWVKIGEMSSSSYWIDHICKTVEYHKAISTLQRKPSLIYLEMGPGVSLSNFIRKKTDSRGELAVHFLKHSKEAVSDSAVFMQGLTQLYLSGLPLSWETISGISGTAKCSAPLYPFERKEYKADYQTVWTDIYNIVRKKGNNVQTEDSNLYLPSWKYTGYLSTVTPEQISSDCILIFLDDMEQIPVSTTTFANEKIIFIRSGSSFKECDDNTYTIRIDKEEDYRELFSHLASKMIHPVYIFNIRTLAAISNNDVNMAIMESMVVVYINRQVADQFKDNSICYIQLATYSVNISSESFFYPLKYVLSGVVKRVKSELDNVDAFMFDLDEPTITQMEFSKICGKLIAILRKNKETFLHVIRNGMIYKPVYHKLLLQEEAVSEVPVKEGGVYLITGGTGGIGQHLVKSLLERKVRLILIGRKNVIPAWYTELIDEGKMLYFMADMGSKNELDNAMRQAVTEFGPINGVFHAAGIDEPGSNLFTTTAQHIEQMFRAKVEGTLYLRDLAIKSNFDFVLLFSSVATVLNNVFNLPYITSNAFLDAICYDPEFQEATQVMCINWPAWNTGMGTRLQQMHQELDIEKSELKAMMETSTALDTMFRLMSESYKQVIIYPDVATWESKMYPVPDMDIIPVDNVVGEDELLEGIRAIWKQHFKYENIDINANFFSLGGDSLSGLKFIKSYRKFFQDPNITIDILYKYPTIKKLVAWYRRYKSVQTDDENRVIFPKPSLISDNIPLPLTYNQQRIWFICALNEESNSYNIVNRISIPEEYNEIVIDKSFQLLMKYHTVLATRFKVINGIPMQIIDSEPRVDIHFIELHSEDEEQIITETMNRESLLSFDLRNDRLFRIKVFRKPITGFELVITIHHIIADAWSMNILANDFQSIYTSALENKEIELPLNPVTFRSFAAWEQALRENPNAKEHPSFKYWADILSDFNTMNEKKNSRFTKLSEGKGGSLTCYINLHLLEDVKQLAMLCDTSVFVILYSGFNILLSSILKQENIICPIAASGRSSDDMGKIVGFFSNTLPLKHTIDEEVDIDCFIKQVHQLVNESLVHQNFPLDIVLDHLQMKFPPLRFFFNMQNVDLSKMRMVDYENYIENVRELSTEVKFDLTVYLNQYTNCVKLEFVFNTDVFSTETITMMPEQYRNILKKMYEGISTKKTLPYGK